MAKSFSRTKLARHIAESVGQGENSNDLANRVAAFLIETGKTSELNSLLRDAVEENARLNGFLEVKTISAYELDESEKKKIEQLARKQYPDVKKVVIQQEKDSKIVGGVRILFPHDQLDLSLRSKLNRLANAR